jgi:hypothetical protein
MTPLSNQLQRVFTLLQMTQPVPDEHDVEWSGPYYIPRPGLWCPSRFALYRGSLYARLFILPRWHGLSWVVGSRDAELERGVSAYDNDEYLWTRALTQIESRLRSAVKNFSRYNRLVDARMPPSCRTGKIQRSLTWPKDAKPPLPPGRIRQFEGALERAKDAPWLDRMTLAQYLDVVAVAYDAVFKNLRPLSPAEKYERKADGRHGGLLDLPPHDPDAFLEWFTGASWQGTHPWEIVFGHPHGIMISPRHHAERRSWSYLMWADSLGWYIAAARMAIALGERRIPFEFHNGQAVLSYLKGIDEVDVGPDLYSVHYEDLKRTRRDALRLIRWDPIPHLAPITPDQAERVGKALLTSSRVR